MFAPSTGGSENFGWASFSSRQRSARVLLRLLHEVCGEVHVVDVVAVAEKVQIVANWAASAAIFSAQPAARPPFLAAASTSLVAFSSTGTRGPQGHVVGLEFFDRRGVMTCLACLQRARRIVSPVDVTSRTLWHVRLRRGSPASYWAVRPASCADAAEHVHLPLVRVAMGRLAFRGGVLDLVGLQFVQDRRVALDAIDLVVRDMYLVHEYVVADLGQISLAAVAGEARSRGTSPLPRITSRWQSARRRPA